MVLLAVNAGLGNNDCATLPLQALDWKRGWLVYLRPKTGIERRTPFWLETIAALKVVLAKRRTPTNESHKDLVFISPRGDGGGVLLFDGRGLRSSFRYAPPLRRSLQVPNATAPASNSAMLLGSGVCTAIKSGSFMPELAKTELVPFEPYFTIVLAF